MKAVGKSFALCALLLLALCPSASAQQRTKPPIIGFLSAITSPAISTRTDAFKQGLQDFGYVEGRNIIVEYRWADGKADRLVNLAAELVGLKPDAIVSAGPTVTHALKQATTTVPIVMAQDIDPVGSGFVASLAKPGGNITGLSMLSAELSGKRLEMIKEIIPELSRVAIFGTSTQPGNAQSLKETEVAARALAGRAAADALVIDAENPD